MTAARVLALVLAFGCGFATYHAVTAARSLVAFVVGFAMAFVLSGVVVVWGGRNE